MVEGNQDGSSGAGEGVCLERGVVQKKTLGEDFSVHFFSMYKCCDMPNAIKLFQPMSDDMFSCAGSLAILTLPPLKIGS